ncbi:MAG: carboxypeptidase-like regulatory domain-containing protein [Tannerella sp.]|jgi:hypothetical protein|nr:carboxypeptidase-like regulatory domain-containing protein [Tannerella sp.]
MRKEIILLCRRDTWRKALCVLCVLMSCSLALHAQKRVSGTVADVNGEPVIGANILEKGTGNGVITDLDGKFAISVAENAVLQISYIGYLSQEVKITAGGSSVLTILLQEDNRMLDEVVVVGYGTQKKVTLSGSISSVKGDEVVKSPAIEATQMITGLMPGLSVIQRSGQPGVDEVNEPGRNDATTPHTRRQYARQQRPADCRGWRAGAFARAYRRKFH